MKITGKTKSGRKYTITYPECPYIGCDFYSKKFGSESKNEVINHIEIIHQKEAEN